jgi:hypothetical protein
MRVPACCTKDSAFVALFFFALFSTASVDVSGNSLWIGGLSA